MAVWIGAEAFDAGTRYGAFLAGRADAGAAVSFTGLVRSLPADPLLALELECYPELALAELERLREEAVARFSLLDADIAHRFGRLVPGETIMQVTTLAPHRAAAFDGAAFLMDYLKTDAPFWKKEIFADREVWVEPRASDDAARARWRNDDN
jgi:molybdopterin synthase catalytic subunit